jgi:hypothetical protein
MADNWNYTVSGCESLPCPISTISVTIFTGYVEMSIYGLPKARLLYISKRMKSYLPNND